MNAVDGVVRRVSWSFSVSKQRFVKLAGTELVVTLGPETDSGEREVTVHGAGHPSTFRCLTKLDAALVDGQVFRGEGASDARQVVFGGRRFPTQVTDRSQAISGLGQAKTKHRHASLRSPLPGQVVAVLVKQGDQVESGQRLILIEAMKMQNPIVAERAGRVSRLKVSVNDSVQAGQLLLELET